MIEGNELVSANFFARPVANGYAGAELRGIMQSDGRSAAFAPPSQYCGWNDAVDDFALGAERAVAFDVEVVIDKSTDCFNCELCHFSP